MPAHAAQTSKPNVAATCIAAVHVISSSKKMHDCGGGWTWQRAGMEQVQLSPNARAARHRPIKGGQEQLNAVSFSFHLSLSYSISFSLAVSVRCTSKFLNFETEYPAQDECTTTCSLL